MATMSPEIQEYFTQLSKQVHMAYEVASAARKKGFDPELEVNILLARNMAERVVGLVSVVAPQLMDTKLTERILELEQQYGSLDWRVGFIIAGEVAEQRICTFSTRLEAIEVGIRVGFAYLTLGIVSAPLEGFIGLKIKQRKDGKEYFALQYAGPIRGAGGTAASTSVLLSDYVRVRMGYAAYDPEETEVQRYITEIHDYHERVTNLQYHPSDEELRFMASHLPVEVDGDPTEKFEVSNYKDLPRIPTNLIRGGMALVMAEGLCQKAPKLWKRISKWGREFGLSWEWLGDFIKLKEQIHAAHTGKEPQGGVITKTVKPNNTYLMDLVAGRPILTHPLATGGFRLRYGRGRTTGFSAAALHPATLIVLQKFIAIGTQLKVERPGKGCTITLCDVLDGPIVRLVDGSVVWLKTEALAKEFTSRVEEIIFLGDILFNYGDFSENGQSLVPAGYCPEWWAVEVEKASIEKQVSVEKQVSAPEKKKERLCLLIEQPLVVHPSWEEAVAIGLEFNVPLHPDFTYFWKLLSNEQLEMLLEWLRSGTLVSDEQGMEKIILDAHPASICLGELGLPHQMINREKIVIERQDVQILGFCLGFTTQEELQQLDLPRNGFANVLDRVNARSPIILRDKAGTFIGARMGRPEKAKMRTMTGSPQVMFPVGDEGDRLRSFQAALQAGKVRSAFPFRVCSSCGQETVYLSCLSCGQPAIQRYHCRMCGDLQKEQCRHGPASSYKIMDLPIQRYFKHALDTLGERVAPDLVKGIRGTSNKHHVVEHLAKGILRAKHHIYVNKDGTTRYDATELPLTHFKPKEIQASIEKLKILGYTHDMSGVPLTSSEQLLELKPQDLVLPGFNSLDESAPQVLVRVAQYIDELLVKLYHLPPFYNIRREEDLIGHVVIGLAPHISAGLIGRIIGFSETQGLLAHPMYHAGLRRDCDGDEACVILLMDGLLNFSRKFLPNTRGSTMDSPLVLTVSLNPTEVDDQVHGVDVEWKYPLEFYEAAMEMKKPWEVQVNGKKIQQLGDRLGTPLQYEQFGFTHPVDNFNKGVQCSAYKLLPSMEEKLLGQMEIAKKVRAVDLNDVARLVIQKHFLRDIKGNLRKFSLQQFRCVKCNEKYRRPPLLGNCTACGNRLLCTITEGSVLKYLGPSLLLAEKYDFSPYLKQTLDILRTNTEKIFGKEKEKQVGLEAFVK